MSSSSSFYTTTLLLYYVLPPIHIGYRIYTANRIPIMDCDETYNYWEVVHYLLYKNGYQTWEYSNEYALRTYAYLTPLIGISKLFQSILLQVLSTSNNNLSSWSVWPMLTDNTVTNEKVALFVLLRVTLGIWMAYAEITFCQAIAECFIVVLKRTPNKNKDDEDDRSSSSFYVLVAIVTQVLLMTSTGMSHAANALLPSSTLMGLWLFGAAAYLKRQHIWFVTFAVIATLAIGWPFGVIMFIPLGVGILYREYNNSINHLLILFVKILLITASVQGIVMTIDYMHYGRIVSPVWNILMYNTKAGGDELYGIEPFSYYVKNLFLNLNYVAPVGILAGLLFVPFIR